MKSLQMKHSSSCYLRTEGAWQWANGDPLTGFNAWGPKEPNGDRGENCLMFIGGAWNDASCAKRVPHLCEFARCTIVGDHKRN